MSASTSSQVPYPLSKLSLDELGQSLPAIITISLVIVAVLSFVAITGKSKIPLANPPRWNQIALFKRIEFFKNGRAIMSEARKRYGKQPYRLISDSGEILVLPPAYAATIRNETDLSFGQSAALTFSGHVSGFEPFGLLATKKKLVQTVVKKQLTKYLNTVTKPLSEEATFALDVVFGNSPEWNEKIITDSILQLVARLSTKVFLGDEMCRNEAWLEVSKAYTITSFVMTLKMAALPQSLKFLVPWFSKEAKVVRQHLAEIRTILTPLFDKRKSIKAEARKNGKPEPVYNDMIEWYEQESQGVAYDPAMYQTVLVFAAIHTTSELLSNTMMFLADEPKYVKALREEIIQVLRTDGLTKAALANLKLVDSTLKETQRFRPTTFINMKRLATRKVVLPDGIIINKGEQVAVDGFNMHDPDVYSDPETYDIYRYYRMRQDPATANKAHLVSTGPDNLSFGHGSQSCPGRFFAANEVKIALCHLLLKYDWELAPGASLESKHLFGEFSSLDSTNKVRLRRRKEEVDLENLVFT